MSETNKPGIVFWIVGIIALLWEGMGVNAYLQSAFKTEASTEGLTAEQIAFLDGMPAWYTALFALAVFSGLIAAILFLMRKKLAATLFFFSFACALINQLYWFFGTNGRELFDQFGGTIMPVLVIVLGIFFVWYSKDQKAKNVLN